jgi:hypothetical protein
VSAHSTPLRPVPLRPVPLRPIGVLVACWVAVWIALGVWTGYEVNALRTLSDTAVTAGVAVRSTGDALQEVGVIPLVGARVGRVGRQVSAAGTSAVASGRSTRGTIDRLAVLLGLAVGLVPSAPVLLLYYVVRRVAAGAAVV